MNRRLFTFILIALVTIASSFATLYQNNDLVQGYQTVNGQFVQTGSITGVQAVGFVCANADCSQVAQQIFDGNTLSSSGDSLQTYFPNDALYLADYGYGIYYFKDGYIPYEQRVTQNIKTGIVGDHTDPNVETVQLSQLEMCRSIIDDFDVTNSVYPNQPVMIDIVTNLNANAYSPIQNAGPNEYIPTQIRRQYQVEVQVTLDIVNDRGQVVDQQTQSIYVDFSGNKEVRFEYVPSDTGRYTARVTTSTTDSKCVDTQSHISQKDFSVINQGPIEQCYSQLQNLAVTPQYPVQNSPVVISVDKISSYYDQFGNLHPLATDVELVVKQDGQTVHTESKRVSPNTNILDAQNVDFDFTPTNGGYYTVNIFADTVSCPYNVDESDSVSQTIFVQGNPVTPVDPNEAPVWVAVPDIVLYEGQTQSLQLTNYVTDPNGDDIIIDLVSQSNTQVASCSLSNSGLLTCNGIADGSNVVRVLADDNEDSRQTTVNVIVLEPNTAPVITNLPDQLLPAGVVDNQNLFDLDNYASDIDGDSLSYTIVTNTNDDFVCSIDANNNLDCQVLASEGFTDLTIVVSDGELQDSDIVRITINQVPVNLAPTANFTDVYLFANSGLNTNIFTVSDFISDPENDVLSVQFVSESRKDIVDCTIHNDRFDCNVKDNMVGVSVVTLSVFDGSNIIQDSFNVIVQDTPNTAPVIENIPDQYLDENTGFNSNLVNLADYSFDVDGDSLTYRIFSESDTSIVDCSISGSLVSCDVQPNQIGFSTVRVEVSDGQEIDTDSFIVYVRQVVDPNNAPVIVNIPDQFLNENSGFNSNLVNLADYSFDVDGDSLTYRIFSESDTSVVDCSVSGSLVNCDVQPNRIGDSTVRVEVSDGQEIDTDSFVVTVVPVQDPNNAPVIANIPDQYLDENSGFNSNILNLANYASDIDGDSLSYSIISESGLSVVDCSISGTSVSCDVEPNQIGSSVVTVQVSDGLLTDTDSFVVYVQEVIIPNNPPTANFPDQILNSNSGLNEDLFVLDDFAFDIDGDSLSYQIVGESNLGVVNCDIVQASVDCTVLSGVNGSSIVTIQVSDGIDTITDSFVVSVIGRATNGAPSLNLDRIDVERNGQASVDLTNITSDPDGDIVELMIVSQSQPDIVHCSLSGTSITCAAQSNRAGESRITIKITDGFVTVHKTVQVVVADDAYVRVQTPSVEQYLSFAQVKHPSVIDVQSADIPISMTLRNGGDVDFTNVRVSVMIPELGTKRTFGPFDLDTDDFESRNVVLPLYYQPEPGYYWIRFSVTSDEGEDRIMYREVLLQ